LGFFSALVKTAIETVQLPVAVVKDIATLGLEKAVEDEFYTERQLKEIKKAAEDQRTE